MSKILCIPNNKMPYENGFSKITDKEIWTKYNDDWIYLDKEYIKTKKGFISISPFIIIKNQFNEYLINNSKDTNTPYSMNIQFNTEIEECYGLFDPLFKKSMSMLEECVNMNSLKYEPMKHLGYVKEVLDNQNKIGIVMQANAVKTRNRKNNYKWLTINELIEKHEKFDSWSKHYIDYIVKEKLNEKN